MQPINTREYLEKLEAAIEEQNVAFIRESMEDVHPADISQVLDELNTPQSKYVIDLLPPEVSAEILSNLDEETTRRFLRVFESAEIAALVPYMDSDDAADLLDHQPVRFREEVIALIDDRETAEHIIELLHYDEDCAGGLMAKELIKAYDTWNVVQTIEEIRRQAENVEKIHTIYVVDSQERLLGKVSIKRILLAKANTRIADIFDRDLISVESYRDKEEVSDLMQKYDLEAIPVVNIQNRLLGRITIDDIVDVITEKAEEDIAAMSGISAGAEEDDGVFRSVRARLPWLLIGMAGGLIGAQLMGLFEGDLKEITALALFTPLITATGGNVGIQNSTVVVQSLGRDVFSGNKRTEKIIRALGIAVVNAITISLIVFVFFLLYGRPFGLALVVSIALFSVVILASITGTVTPLVLDRYGVNPALASGPFITTANDLLGLTVYFSVAHWLRPLLASGPF
ncbi:MAG: magnesium transporter [Bacteroidota bacterium]